jgi:formylglycine-generating enzyme required for sulfatase activity
VVLASKTEARRFMDWLAELCRDGYLTEDHEMEPRFDTARDLAAAKVNPKWVKQGLRPFWSVVRYVPPARIAVTSEPPGAAVYQIVSPKGEDMKARLLGHTPLVDEDGEPGVRVRPGQVVIRVEKEGFRSYRHEFTLKSHDAPDPVHVELEKNQKVVFGTTWENSLGMRFEPVGADLMVSAWETRVQDYMKFLDESGVDKPDLRAELIGMDPSLPVIFVNREDAQEFCRWLTEIERQRERIAQKHEYRLPTDLEWSRMAGLEPEGGDWPQDRNNQQVGGYPWGRTWPPPPGAGNFADESAAGLEGIPENKIIPGYNDGFESLAPVGMSSSNFYNLFDLAGNVHEWVSDDYNPAGTHGVTRGGGWKTHQENHLRSAARNAVNVGPGGSSRNQLYGFRVVLAKIPESLEDATGGSPDEQP